MGGGRGGGGKAPTGWRGGSVGTPEERMRMRTSASSVHKSEKFGDL